MKHHNDDGSRRAFLQQVGAWSALLAAGQAQAQSTSGYKALVCIYLAGGNDAYNTVLATDEASWASYNLARGQGDSPIALLKAGTPADAGKLKGSPAYLGGVLPISPATPQAGRSFALHPSLKDVQSLFNSKRLAVVANVGPMVASLSKDAYLAGSSNIPPKLYSHNDQQSAWQGGVGQGAVIGWGGRLVDAATSNASGLFNAVSIAGNAQWLAGTSGRPYHLGASGPIKMAANGGFPSAVNEALKRISSNGLVGANATGQPRDKHLMGIELGSAGMRSISAESTVSSALASYPASQIGGADALKLTNLWGNSETNALAAQLQMVARMMAASQAKLGVSRQVFFVQLGGFDTHDNQNLRHADLLLRLNHALKYFDAALSTLGLQDKVTTFTSSEFGRTFTSNGDGTDHGWGGHHFVMGGAVKGGDIYGNFPTYGTRNSSDNRFSGSNQQLHNGVLLPELSVDQMGATLGRWFLGPILADGSNLNAAFQSLKNFSQQDVGFMIAA
jgi:uncharacterized protein (DUF1501 family)